MLSGGYDRKRIENEFNSIGPASPIVHWDPDKGDVISVVGKKAITLLELNHSDVVLDIGTGRGRWAFEAIRYCRSAIGIDISSNLLKSARALANERGIDNISFFTGSLENLSEETDISQFRIDKIMAVYAMHHLTDPLKKVAVSNMVRVLNRPGIIVVGDLIWSEEPEKYRDEWENVYYDDGDTDFPADVEYLTGLFRETGARVDFTKIHPLVGIVRAVFD